ncbi:ankyrin repeat-containing domain protein [Jimgerdemannia flammicorona]|uniref:Ankyrin repeat-containing domain protein n=1 Tax=Jimgerdemannia flammicorona TaxID=994334 RepID=A0A433DL10_9FUNG|nr:ankyrin repeat-containing domain protein [Jimgerdemannia flammicorona]
MVIREYMAGRVVLYNNEWTLLHEAAKLRDLKLIEILIMDLKANVNHQGYNKITPLHIAVENNLPEVVKILCATFGADIEIKDQQNRTAL